MKVTMSELIAVGFKQDMYRASAVLNKLSAMDDSWVVGFHDAVAVYRVVWSLRFVFGAILVVLGFRFRTWRDTQPFGPPIAMHSH